MMEEAKIYFFIDQANYEFLRSALYLSASATIGALILKSVNFHLETENKASIDLLSCWTCEGYEVRDGRKTGRHAIVLTVRGDACTVVSELARKNDAAMNTGWLNHIIQTYAFSLQNNLPMARREDPRPSIRADGILLQ